MSNAKPTSEHRRNGYKSYRARGLREKNKIFRLVRHLKKYPKDKTAQGAFDELASIARVRF